MKKFHVIYNPATDLIERIRISRSNMSFDVIAALMHSTTSTLSSRLKGYRRFSDNDRSKLIDILDNPESYRKYPELTHVKREMDRCGIGVSMLAKSVYEGPTYLGMSLDGYRKKVSHAQDKFYIRRIRELHDARPDHINEWARLMRKKKKTTKDRQRMLTIYNEHFKNIAPKPKPKPKPEPKQKITTRWIFDWDILCSQPYKSAKEKIRVRKYLFKYFVNIGIPQDKREPVVEWLRLYRKPIKSVKDLERIDTIHDIHFVNKKGTV